MIKRCVSLKSNDYKKVGSRNWFNQDKTPRSKMNEHYENIVNESPSTGKLKNKNKQTKKSNHKHMYEDILCKTPNGHLHTGQRCVFCGRLKNIDYFMFEKTIDGYFKVLSNTEIKERYPNLEIIEIG